LLNAPANRRAQVRVPGERAQAREGLKRPGGQVAHWGRPGTGFPLPLPRRAVLAFTWWVEGVRCRMCDVSRVGVEGWLGRPEEGVGMAEPPRLQAQASSQPPQGCT